MSTATFGIRISGNAKGGVDAINLTNREIKRLRKQVDGYSGGAKKAAASSRGLGVSFKQLLGPIAAFVSLTGGLKKLVEVSREFDVLNAQLITSTGSAESASVAFGAIRNFAETTPFDLAQTTKAFTQLINLGLTPSEKALRSYGDTASAMGKDLSQLVEAVADAATGEFERLKEFGIKAKSEGDNVSFTFRGVTTTVKKNAEEIEQYLIGLGENNFSDAMANRMATLDGAISNLGDSWDSLFLTISNQGAGTLITDSVVSATEAVEELKDVIASGQLQAGIEAIGSKFDGIGEDAAESLDIVGTLLSEAYKEWSAGTGDLGDDFKAAFVNLPENIRAFVQIMTVELASFVDKAGIYGDEIADRLKFWDGDTNDFTARIKGINDVRAESISTILEERNTAVESFKQQAVEVTNLRNKYDELKASKQAANQGKDVLAQFGIEPPEIQSQSNDPVSKEFNRLAESLLSEEEKIRQSYARRKEIILNNTEESSRQRQDLIQRLDAEFAEQALGEFAQPDTIEEELFRLETNYQARLQLIRQQLGEQSELEVRLTREKEERKAQLEQKAQQQRLQYASNFFGGVAQLAEAAGGRQSKAFKAAATAQALVNTYQAATGAYSAMASIPYVGPVLGAAAAAEAIVAGMQNVRQIQSTSTPSYEGGGFTGFGPRSGGVDGKGGFPAVLHPNETVIDHTKGQGVSENNVVHIDFNITTNDSQSFQEAMAENSDIIKGVVIQAFNERGQRSPI